MRIEAVIGGTVVTAGEWATTAQFMCNTAVASPSQLQTIANAVHAALSADATFKSTFCSDTQVNNVKLLYYSTNVKPATYVATSTGAAFTGSVAPVHAPQICVVASLRSNLPGRSYRGRMYVPYRGSQIAATGIVAGAGQTLAAGYANKFQTAVKNALADAGIGSAWVVWSGVQAVATAITTILVGNHCDTQRNRNPNRDEVYTPSVPTGIELPDDDETVSAARTQAALQEIANNAFDPIKVPEWVPPLLTAALTRLPPP